jgi:hypothetical protein
MAKRKAAKPTNNRKRARTTASNSTVSERCRSIAKKSSVHPDLGLAVCAEDADVILQSSDNVLFKIRRQQLEANSEAFSGAEAFSTQDEIVNLTEPAAILDLLLQYMHIQKPPELTDLEFDSLLDLTEAAHKYGVPFATYACMEQVQCVTSKFEIHIFDL